MCLPAGSNTGGPLRVPPQMGWFHAGVGEECLIWQHSDGRGFRPSGHDVDCPGRRRTLTDRSLARTGHNAGARTTLPRSVRQVRQPKPLGLHWDSDTIGREVVAPFDKAKFLILQWKAGARGIRTLVAGYPTNRISRPSEQGARWGTDGHYVFPVFNA
jgi:hypothetical protein